MKPLKEKLFNFVPFHTDGSGYGYRSGYRPFHTDGSGYRVMDSGSTSHLVDPNTRLTTPSPAKADPYAIQWMQNYADSSIEGGAIL